MNAKQKFYITNRATLNGFTKKFPDYHETVTLERLQDFLNQFSVEHMNLGLRVLEKVDYFSNARTTNKIKSLISSLRQNFNINLKCSNVYFCSMSLSSGTSADTMMRKLRNASNLSSRKYTEKFIHLRSLEQWKDEHHKKIIIFVDDFIGSGETITNLWNVLQNWYNENHVYYIGVIAGYQSSIKQIEEDLPFKIICAENPFPESTRAFHVDNNNFSKKEKIILKKYCKRADPRRKFVHGYNNTQSLVVFYENTPNNSIPILHHSGECWEFPIFPRME